MNHDKRPIALEDLLRLKRAERPPAEFWNQFDRELRAKQLAALVARRPWWTTIPRALGGLVRLQLLLGATSVLAVTFLAMRNYHAVAVAPNHRATTPVVTEVAAPAPFAPSAAEPIAAASEEPAPSIVAELPSAPPAGDLAASRPRLVSLERQPAPIAATAELATPSARYIAANLAAAQAAAPVVTRGLLASARGFENRASVAHAAAMEPLAQMTSPSDIRRARFASALATSSSNEAFTRPTERTTRTLSEEQVYDGGARRYDAKGDRFTWKL